ncbi:uncharacterized protein LOC112525102 isoform X2 [Cynara cardunculus var. scolymus]|uniref:uncharacterized protein LOC112525102 isoform X2 n=1 Tax=Cynara cardunculus var. scolymus TaxID=59895 RepID=UPI000D6231B9|nr:uncharacterized protein LOC112525102 isoform X2 [Cynara cardunculus var. scolymus]
MAFMNYTISRVCIHPKYSLLVPHKTKNFNFISSTTTVAALSEKGTDGSIGENDSRNASAASPSARTRLDLLEQLTSTSPSGYESDGNYAELTIREKLAQLVGERDDDFSIRLGKKLKIPKLLTVSQKRNIKRQAYLNEVSRRNDTNFFAIIGAFVLLPPLIILGVAIATGYVQLFP